MPPLQLCAMGGAALCSENVDVLCFISPDKYVVLKIYYSYKHTQYRDELDF